MLGVKCAGAVVVIIGTLGMAPLFVGRATREGRFVPPCATLMGVTDPTWPGEVNKANVDDYNRSVAEGALIQRGGAVITNPDGSKSYVGPPPPPPAPVVIQQAPPAQQPSAFAPQYRPPVKCQTTCRYVGSERVCDSTCR